MMPGQPIRNIVLALLFVVTLYSIYKKRRAVKNQEMRIAELDSKPGRTENENRELSYLYAGQG